MTTPPVTAAPAPALRRARRTSTPVRRALHAAALGLVVCIAGGCGPRADPAEIVVADSALVGVLADLHVLDARRHLVRDDSAADAARPDSLRKAVLAHHGYDEGRLRRDVAALDARPDRLALTWASVQDTADARLRRLDTPAPQ